MTPIIRPARAEDMDAFYEKKNQGTMRALVAELDGKPIAIGGIMYQDGKVVAFSQMKEEMRKFPMTIMRGAKAITKLLKGSGAIARASDQEKHAPKLLSHLGFETLDARSRTYRWRG